jgi:hypothetical protein
MIKSFRRWLRESVNREVSPLPEPAANRCKAIRDKQPKQPLGKRCGTEPTGDRERGMPAKPRKRPIDNPCRTETTNDPDRGLRSKSQNRPIPIQKHAKKHMA